MSGYWIEINGNWEDVPAGAFVALWEGIRDKPAGIWYSSKVINTISSTTENVVSFRDNYGTVNTYPKSTLNTFIFKYLVEYEPYDPNQESEDDCV